MASEEKGVWRTIGGRRVFIKDGQSLADAMIESGKFKNDLRSSYVKAKEEDKKKKEEESIKKNAPEGVKTKQLIEETGVKTFADEIKGSEDKERLEIAKDIAKEVYGKNMGEELLERKAREILEPQEGEVLEEGDKPYTNAKGELERSTKYLKEWQEQLKGSKEEPKLSEKQIEAGNKLNANAEKGVREDIKSFLSGKEDYDGSREDFIRDLSDNWGVDKDKVEEILHEESSKSPRNFKSDRPSEPHKLGQTNSSDEKIDLDKKENKEGFISQSTNPFYADKEYFKEDLKKMEESGVKPMKNTYSGSGWEGVNSNKNLTTSEQAKAITSAMKEKYPEVEIARKSSVYSGGSSITFSVMSSDKDLYISDKDIDNLSTDKLYNSEITRGWGFERWANDNVPNYRTEHTFTDKDVRNYAKKSLAELKKRDNQSVRGDEWYLSDYGKEVMKELNKQADSYTYDDSDAMTDYFNHGTYMWVNIGKYDKPYQVKESKSTKSSGNQITNSLQQKAYEKYKREHPNSKLTFEQFKKEQD